MKRLLITGASGLLGLNMALEAAEDFEVFGVAHGNSISSPDFTVRATDLLEPEAVERTFDWARPDWVVHCAALANLDVCEANPDLAVDMNAVLPGRMAAEAAKRDVRFMHISTDAVFDGVKGEYTEDDAVNPLSTYARTKLAGEKAVAQANPLAIISRVVFYGWSLSGQRSLGEFFFNDLSRGKRVNGFADVYFSPLLVNDLANILLEMMGSGLQGLFHVFSADAISKYDFGVAIARRFGFDESLIARVSSSAGGLMAARSPNLSMRSGKLTAALGRSLPMVSAGLDRFKELYLQGYPQKLRSLMEAVH